MRVRTKLKAGTLLGVLVFLSVVSQISLFVERGITEYISFPIWLITGIYVFIKKKAFVSHDTFDVLVVLFLFASTLLDGFTDMNYLGTRILRQVIIAYYVYFIGRMFSYLYSVDLLVRLSNALFWGCVVLAMDTYLNFYTEGVRIGTSEYQYDSKNSAALILLTGLILLLLTYKYNTRRHKRIKALAGLFVFYVMFIMGSRAVIICLPFLAMWVLISSNLSIRVKLFFSVLLVSLGLLVLINDRVYAIVDQAISGGRNLSNINDFSSGRVSHLIYFVNTFPNVYLIGAGKFKLESFPLSVIYQYGVFIGALLLILSIIPIIRGLRLRHPDVRIESVCLILLGGSYIINGMFEELAPFGPGIKCFMLWFILGLSSQLIKEEKVKIKNVE